MTTPRFLPGLELSRRFYHEAVLPILDAEVPGLPHAAARLGSGSEVLGFDTARSADHEWGPRLQLFLAADDVTRYRERLMSAFAYQLPKTFLGYPTHFEAAGGDGHIGSMQTTDGPVRHRVEIADVDSWLAGCLGFTPSRGVTTADWLATPTQRLLEATSGAVFHDGLGPLTTDRERLAWYPDDMWRYVLACQWKRLAQEEAFVGRCGEVGDELGSAVVGARLVRDVMRLVLLMERRYPPYSKWLGSAFARTSAATELMPHMIAALAATDWKARERALVQVYERVAALHNSLELTDRLDPSARLYFERPFQVIGAHRFAEALMQCVDDQDIRALPTIGAIDQFADSTDFLGRAEFTRGAITAAMGGTA
ncbi:conserved hypothetical protein [Catenulispora acidiphila DSM 44928]|uniref:DUF4037 domain-containing protein n=1 Tax=Catenulispora acidiphila (strain DSM 44928 / JCM 14897 / NBRC 102108 / NRRL B-24433 / ID139908) TaxID=479433 RepID=C7Q6K4_CATAD|nr:DUF4037 domain-containing protein [Catenulispora acidiphila]ACU74039.1 conserved hypothetical protein [Catenulispora acidiphila DSM 44928]